MKDYKRLTDRVIAEMLRNTEEESWDSDNIEAQCYIRLAEIEDKIERDELDYVADRDKQIACLTAENDNFTVELEVAQRDIDNLTRTLEEANDEIKALEAENAELRARLEKAEELPAKVGDRVFYIIGFAPDFAPAAVEEFEIEEILIQKSTTIFRLIGVDTGIKTVVFLSWYNKRWFTELEAAEARLKELGGRR